MLRQELVPKLKHDELVLQQALELVSAGFDVQARLEGLFEVPDVINGYRPDIVGRLDNQVVLIVEIVKGDVDWPKRAAFEQYVWEHPKLKLQLLHV